MKLFSITDMTLLLQGSLHNCGFSTIQIRKGVIQAVQADASGRVFQRFLIKVEDPPSDPV